MTVIRRSNSLVLSLLRFFDRSLGAILGAILLSVACGDGGASGGGGGPVEPDEEPAVLRVTASDLDGAAGALSPAGFEVGEVTSYRVRVTSGTVVAIDSSFPGGTVALQREFRVEPNSYLVLVEGFQSGDVLLFSGAERAAVAAGDTAAVRVDLDPSLGAVELTIGGTASAVVPTNGTAPVRAVVRNEDGRPVAGARVDVSVDPASAGEVALDREGETGADGSVTGTFTPVRREGQGRLRVTVDGLAATADEPPSFSIVSPVDAIRSTLTIDNSVFLRADGTSAAEIRVRVVNAAGTPQVGIPIVLRSSRNAGPDQMDTIRSDRAETNAAGEFAATLTTTSSSILAGDALITVEADGKRLADTGTISFRSIVSATRVDVSVAPPIVPADGSSTATVEVLVLDTEDQPVTGALVELRTKDDSLFQIRPVSGRSNASGIFRATISSMFDESTVIGVSADGLQVSDSGFVIFRD